MLYLFIDNGLIEDYDDDWRWISKMQVDALKIDTLIILDTVQLRKLYGVGKRMVWAIVSLRYCFRDAVKGNSDLRKFKDIILVLWISYDL